MNREAAEALGGVLNVESMGLGRGLRDQPDAIVIEHVEQGDETPRLVAQIGSQHQEFLEPSGATQGSAKVRRATPSPAGGAQRCYGPCD